ncbi:uncharacterized protein LOC115534011 isoform X3 [Gadus morhua]|uniref:uncharacterized protein LOC115534011 isoform X3 n=1 Tax=Gadus morhua TaxID=8049 RepID=UPI0011B3D46F|nr:uncharacterized protein LOC115534011 isoform X3 [Gadus morhua]
MVMAGQDFGAEGKAAVNRLTTTVREWGKRSKEWAESSLKSVIPKVDSRQAYHKYRFTTVNGLNLNTDNDLVEKLKAKGHTQVKSSDPCDYILAFCPISTRPGINIQETMEMCTGTLSLCLWLQCYLTNLSLSWTPKAIMEQTTLMTRAILVVEWTRTFHSGATVRIVPLCPTK